MRPDKKPDAPLPARTPQIDPIFGVELHASTPFIHTVPVPVNGPGMTGADQHTEWLRVAIMERDYMIAWLEAGKEADRAKLAEMRELLATAAKMHAGLDAELERLRSENDALHRVPRTDDPLARFIAGLGWEDLWRLRQAVVIGLLPLPDCKAGPEEQAARVDLLKRFNTAMAQQRN